MSTCCLARSVAVDKRRAVGHRATWPTLPRRSRRGTAWSALALVNSRGCAAMSETRAVSAFTGIWLGREVAHVKEEDPSCS
jgi:hypothetical protein